MIAYLVGDTVGVEVTAVDGKVLCASLVVEVHACEETPLLSRASDRMTSYSLMKPVKALDYDATSNDDSLPTVSMYRPLSRAIERPSYCTM
jgi:hypothetical protein